MTIATKNGSILIKNGRVARGCECCGVCGCGRGYTESIDVEVVFDNLRPGPSYTGPYAPPALTSGCFSSLEEAIESRNGIYTLALDRTFFPLGYYRFSQTTTYGNYPCGFFTVPRRDILSVIVDLRECYPARFGVYIEGDARDCDFNVDPLQYILFPVDVGSFFAQGTTLGSATLSEAQLMSICESFSGRDMLLPDAPVFMATCPPRTVLPGNPIFVRAYVDITVRIVQNPLP